MQWELVIAIASAISALIGATWFLSTRIGELAISIATNAASDSGKHAQHSADIDRHEKRLDNHDERLTAVEQGRLMVAVLHAMKQVDVENP